MDIGHLFNEGGKKLRVVSTGVATIASAATGDVFTLTPASDQYVSFSLATIANSVLTITSGGRTIHNSAPYLLGQDTASNLNAQRAPKYLCGKGEELVMNQSAGNADIAVHWIIYEEY